MEILLKKTKINKSIIEQSMSANYSILYNNEGYDILGWVMYKGKRKIIVYKRLTTQILTLNYISTNTKDIELFKQSIQLPDSNGGWEYPQKYHIKLYFPDVNNRPVIRTQINETNEEFENIFLKVKKFINEVEGKGQIYI